MTTGSVWAKSPKWVASPRFPRGFPMNHQPPKRVSLKRQPLMFLHSRNSLAPECLTFCAEVVSYREFFGFVKHKASGLLSRHMWRPLWGPASATAKLRAIFRLFNGSGHLTLARSLRLVRWWLWLEELSTWLSRKTLTDF